MTDMYHVAELQCLSKIGSKFDFQQMKTKLALYWAMQNAFGGAKYQFVYYWN